MKKIIPLILCLFLVGCIEYEPATTERAYESLIANNGLPFCLDDNTLIYASTPTITRSNKKITKDKNFKCENGKLKQNKVNNFIKETTK